MLSLSYPVQYSTNRKLLLQSTETEHLNHKKNHSYAMIKYCL